MENTYIYSPEEVLNHFHVEEQLGLSDQQVHNATEKYGRNGTVHRHDVFRWKNQY